MCVLLDSVSSEFALCVFLKGFPGPTSCEVLDSCWQLSDPAFLTYTVNQQWWGKETIWAALGPLARGVAKQAILQRPTTVQPAPVQHGMHWSPMPTSPHEGAFSPSFAGPHHDGSGKRAPFIARMAYRKRLRYWYVRLLVPYVFISEPSFVSPLVFGIDVFLSLGLFIGFSARGFNSENDAFRFQGQVLYDQMGWLFWGQGILFIATWSVGYATPSRSTFGLHVTLAGLRVASCALTAAWIYYFDLLGYFHQASLFLLGVLLIPAAIHLAGAYRRYRLARHKPSARHGAHGWNAAINHSTGFQIRNYSPTERVQRQEAALKTIKDSQIRPDEFFYYPPARLVGAQRRSKMSRFQSLLDFLWEYLNVLRRNDGDPDQVWLMDVVEQDSRSSPENNLFLPCYCCLDTDSHHRASYPAPESSQVLIERQIRDRFLNLPPAKFPGQAGGQNASRTRSNDTVYHKLCKHCTTMCHQSLLLRLQKEPNLQGLWDFMRYSLSSATIAEENFPHWSSAKELSRAARDGCHLCNLIWDTLSPEQMSALLERDEEESIYVKILSPLFYRRRVNGLHDYRADKSLRMVPHFGPGLVPRRWVKRRSAERAVSLGDGPTKQWDEGQVDPIKIHTTGKLYTYLSVDVVDTRMVSDADKYAPRPVFRIQQSRPDQSGIGSEHPLRLDYEIYQSLARRTSRNTRGCGADGGRRARQHRRMC